jgi:hypothetical protein
MGNAGSDNVFSNNVVDGGAQIGISVSNSGVKERTYWANNTISRANTWGAQIQADSGGVQQMYFYKNTFKETPANPPDPLYSYQGHGFRFNPNGSIQNVTLDSNTITANGGIGIEGGDDSSARLDKLMVVNNTITNNGGPAFTGDFGAVGEFFWQRSAVAGQHRHGKRLQQPTRLEGHLF